MSNVFRIIDENQGIKDTIPSKDYVDIRFKALSDALLAHERNIDNPHTSDATTLITTGGTLDSDKLLTLNFSAAKLNSVMASSVIQDSSHRMLTDTQIESFKAKVTSFEVDNAIENLKDQLKTLFNKMYGDLLNSPNIVNEIHKLSEFIAGNSELSHLISLTVIEDKLKNHIESNRHLTGNDRKALNVLLHFINEGIFEKIDTIGEYADKANEAENTKTINGYSDNDIRKTHFGIIFAPRTVTSVGTEGDVMLPTKTDLSEYFKDNPIYNINEVCMFKSGTYIIKNINTTRKDNDGTNIIQGSGDNTRFLIDTLNCANNIFRDLCIEPYSSNIKQMEIIGKNNLKFLNIKFKDVKFIFKEAFNITFRDCFFDNCDFSFSNTSGYIRIIDNYFKDCYIPKYLSKNTIIVNNFQA